MKYKKHEIKRTSTTTSVIKSCFGKNYNTNVHLYEIDGEFRKKYGEHPFLTSIQQCKDFINEQIK